jgi:hypothetical protein
MTLFQKLVSTIPDHQIAGRCGFEIFGLLAPQREEITHRGVRLCPQIESEPSLNLDALFARSAAPVISRSALRGNFLVVACEGDFFATDKIALIRLDARGDEWSATIEVTHLENLNAIPAPRDLYILLYIDVGDRRLRILDLNFTARWFDIEGVEKPPPEPAPPSQLIQFSD